MDFPPKLSAGNKKYIFLVWLLVYWSQQKVLNFQAARFTWFGETVSLIMDLIAIEISVHFFLLITTIIIYVLTKAHSFYLKEELHPKLILSMFCALSENYQHFLEN